jgi:hypothetical protein
MKQVAKIVFGKEQVMKAHNGESFSQEELEMNVKEFVFDTIEERQAFVKGVFEAIGWTECFISED